MKEEHTRLFSHVTADKARIYRTVLGVFASARRQFRLSLRPDEILLEGAWGDARPTPEELALALQQLTDWGNLESQPDTTRVSNLADFYRARFLYRLSLGGEAVESSLEMFSEAMKRRAELQSVALEDIATRLKALHLLVTEGRPDVIKVHEGLRDLVHRFEGLAENAQAFMSGVARGVDLQRAEATTVARYKKQLIDYINRFLGDLVRRSESIGQLIVALEPFMRSLIWEVAQREATDAAPGNEADALDATTRHWQIWTERWKGLRGWFLSTGYEPSQSDHLRARARTAIPQLLNAISAVNDRRSGRSDRSADFRALAYWFAACENDSQAHRMARAAFGLNPARHFSLAPASDETVSPNTSWANGPSLAIHPRLREYGEASPRGVLPRERDRSEERRTLANQFRQEAMQVEAARARLATGRASKLSELGVLNREEFALFLSLLAEALSEQRRPDMAVERLTGDGLLKIKLEPLGVNTRAVIETENGWFSGQDHLLTISDA